MTNAIFNLANLNGNNGFTLVGTNIRERLGFSVSDAGDVNGDGIGDLIVGAPGDFSNNSNTDRGRSYVIFGKTGSFATTLNAAAIDGSNGFLIDGINAGDNVGISVSRAGDLNSDGREDLVIGNAFSTVNGRSNSGSSYIILGNASFSTNFNPTTLNGSNGFIINGLSENDRLGNSVTTVGDINKDGFDDFIVGAPKTTAAEDEVGTTYLVYGKNSSFDASLNLANADASKFTTINGLTIDDSLGISVSDAGDINGDGTDDLIIGASTTDLNGINNTGTAYVIFGRSGSLGADFNLGSLDGSNGFVITGFQENAQLGFSVSQAGDINKDGIDDLIVGARNANAERGAAYIIFGKSSGFAANFDPASLDGSNGFTFYGNVDSQTGFSVSGVGDVNGDSIDDAIIGAPSDSPNGSLGAGSVYVIFGQGGGFSRELYANTLNRTNGLIFNGLQQQDLLGFAVSGAGDINNGGVADIVIGASAADNGTNATDDNFGASYVVAGENFRLTPTGGTPFETNNSGFTLRLAKALNLGTLNIYDGVDASVDVADVTLVRNGTENIRGSLIYNPTNGIVDFVKTGGILEDGNYTVTISGGSNGLIYSDGSDLNLDGDNNPQTNFTNSFTISNGNNRQLNLNDVSRGLGEATPVSITLNDGNGVNNLKFSLKYDTDFLDVSAVNLDAALVNLGWTNSSSIDPLTGTINVQIQGTALAAGGVNLIDLSATTKTGAIYNSSGLLTIEDPLLNGGSIAAQGDRSVQQVTRLGDGSGNGAKGSLDAALIAGVSSSSQVNGGFDGLSLIDPNIIGDFNSSGGLARDDAFAVTKEAVGL
jgi:hypothetical protein